MLLVAIEFHSTGGGGGKSYGSQLGTSNCLVTHILQNIIFCVQRKKETLTERLEGA